MKNAKVGSKKIVKATQPRRVAGVPVRSGVKAGVCEREGQPLRGGRLG